MALAGDTNVVYNTSLSISNLNVSIVRQRIYETEKSMAMASCLSHVGKELQIYQKKMRKELQY